MEKNKALKRMVIHALLFTIACVVVISLFNYRLKNTIDIDTPTNAYIQTQSDIQNEYGKILGISPNPSYDTQSEESMIKAPYTIETEKAQLIVYVTLIKSDEEWKAVSFEIIEVIPNE